MLTVLTAHLFWLVAALSIYGFAAITYYAIVAVESLILQSYEIETLHRFRTDITLVAGGN